MQSPESNRFQKTPREGSLLPCRTPRKEQEISAYWTAFVSAVRNSTVRERKIVVKHVGIIIVSAIILMMLTHTRRQAAESKDQRQTTGGFRESHLVERPSGDEQFDQISHVPPSRNLDFWAIKRPNVKQNMTEYPSITFRVGDLVTIKAGGCVQTGGFGDTWKLYVNPQGPNSDHLYH